MARVNKTEECMFCGNVPCTCNAPEPKPKAAPKASKPRASSKPKPEALSSEEEVVLPTPARPVKVNVLAAMKAAAKPEPTPVLTARPDDEVSPELASALRAFDNLGMIHPEDRRKFAPVLDSPPRPEERAVTWRKMRDYEKGD